MTGFIHMTSNATPVVTNHGNMPRMKDQKPATDAVSRAQIMPTGAFNICCPRDCVSRHKGGTSGAPLNPSESIVL